MESKYMPDIVYLKTQDECDGVFKTQILKGLGMEDQIMTFTKQEANKILEIVLTPSKPNEDLLKAVKTHAKILNNDRVA